MIEAWTVQQVRDAESELMADLPEGELMQRAAAGLADVVRRRARSREARSLIALVGGGNNGGDALYAAAQLAKRLRVSVVTVTETPHQGGAAAARAAGVPVHRIEGDSDTLPEHVRTLLDEADLVLDGLLGIGGRAGLRAAMAALAEAVPSTAYVIAVDLPSGADPAGLEGLGAAVFADETVTFGVPKPVHLLPATLPAVGRLSMVDIGLRMSGVPAVQRLEPRDVAGLWPVPGPGGDKYSRGVVGVVAGGDAYPGAAVLCTGAAAQAGVGMVRYVGPPVASEYVLHAAPEVVPGSGRVQAWVLGPGVDAGDDSEGGQAQVRAIRAALESPQPCVVDAGALELIQGRRRGPTLLTPHAGELARLLSRLDPGQPVDRAAVVADPVGTARRATALTGGTLLLKGSTTVVVEPDADAPVRVQADAPFWLATAGAGDVLAGLAGTLLAAGLEPGTAGSLAALVHGAAAHRANPGGPVRATAVSHAIPGTVAHLLTVC
ncbi:MAG: bifunctional ADP-dependent NAD(P)H-hydrate dehydratase/NAD(P)H-hydrate epimerase [Actinobacteria bacterium]|nr:bifunctional ADP-dependent NAD(P)H-hydrate dehydratase/NAD(P)H-hydrate epimerase [Actinomycetota bacterium]